MISKVALNCFKSNLIMGHLFCVLPFQLTTSSSNSHTLRVTTSGLTRIRVIITLSSLALLYLLLGVLVDYAYNLLGPTKVGIITVRFVFIIGLIVFKLNTANFLHHQEYLQYINYWIHLIEYFQSKVSHKYILLSSCKLFVIIFTF